MRGPVDQENSSDYDRLLIAPAMLILESEVWFWAG